ncbi:hypothetical protein T484DRAFT_1922153 [Baffinella frigidus]|nr:hypothetical protein T484DRAFT_1922153 [Cryptophyta sp. CCMP2293]
MSALSCGGYRGCSFGGSGTGSKGRGSGRGMEEAAASVMNAAPEAAIVMNGTPDWADDGSTACCYGCMATFTLMNRRHHCRHCGKIFCATCCREKRPLPKFDYLQPVRVCRTCAQLCWKAESLLLAIRSDNVDVVRRYVQGGKDCNFYTGSVVF